MRMTTRAHDTANPIRLEFASIPTGPGSTELRTDSARQRQINCQLPIKRPGNLSGVTWEFVLQHQLA